MINVNELKIYSINFLALMTSLTDLDVILKIILSLVAIGYTIHKWYIMHGKNK